MSYAKPEPGRCRFDDLPTRTRVERREDGRLGYLSSKYRGMESLYTEVTWFDSKLWTPEATGDLVVVGADRWCRTHQEWEQVVQREVQS